MKLRLTGYYYNVVVVCFSLPSECIHKPLPLEVRVAAWEYIRRGMKSRPTASRLLSKGYSI